MRWIRIDDDGDSKLANVSLAENTPPSYEFTRWALDGLTFSQKLTNGVSFGPQINASHVKKSDSEIGP